MKITAEISDINCWASDRSRLRATIIKTDSDRLQLTNARVRMTSKDVPTGASIGVVIEMRVRLFHRRGASCPAPLILAVMWGLRALSQAASSPRCWNWEL